MRHSFVLMAALLLVSCAGVGTRFRSPNCPVVPRSRSELPDDLDLRARMRFKIDDREVGLLIDSKGQILNDDDAAKEKDKDYDDDDDDDDDDR